MTEETAGTMSYEQARQVYERAGLGDRVLLGSRSAVPVVDFEAMKRLLDVPRTRGVPVIFTTIRYESSLNGAIGLLQYGSPALVPREGVGDRAQAPREASLFDIQAKYADVAVDEAIAYLEAARSEAAAAA